MVTAECAIIERVKFIEYTECEIPADLEAVRTAVEKLRLFCARHGLSAQRWNEIELAAVEGLNNAIEHGCAGVPDGRVRFRWSWTDDVFEARITDPSSFVPEPVAEPELPEDLLAESGRGAFLMHAMMDSVEHGLEHGRHTLTLRKKVGEKAPVPEEGDTETAAILQAMVEDLSANYENLSAMFRFAEKLAAALSFDDFLRDALQQLLELVRGSEAHLRLAGANGTLELVYSHGLYDPSQVAGFPPLAVEADFIESRVFRTGQQSTVENCAHLPAADPLRRERGSAFACPVRFQDDVLGVLTIFRAEAASDFSAAEINIMRVVAEFIGIARATATLQEQRREQQRTLRELEIAAEIQQSLLPRTFPDNPKVRVFGVSQASREVGGDYFDVIPIGERGERGVLLAIADVMGKGMPAALLATILRAAIRARLDLAATPGALLTEVNRQIQSDLARLDMFITAQVAFLSHEENTLTFASAGHCPILKHTPPSSEVVELHDGGVPLGVLDDVVYISATSPVCPGDRFVFLTDGVYEVQSLAGEMLGLAEIERQIRWLAVGTPAAFCGQLLDYVRNFSGRAQASDDRTLLVVENL